MAVKRIGGFLVLAAAAVGVCFWFYQQSQETKRKEREERAQEERTRQRISQFATEHNAVSDWRHALSSNGIDKIYSAELTPLLVRQDARPVLFIVSVQDVTLKDSQYTIHSEAEVNLLSKLRLRLRATESQAKIVMSTPDYLMERYAIVARIGSVTSLDEVDSGKKDIDISPMSVAEGDCIGVLPLGSYYGDVLDLVDKELKKRHAKT